jgi:hypothetical protein
MEDPMVDPMEDPMVDPMVDPMEDPMVARCYSKREYLALRAGMKDRRTAASVMAQSPFVGRNRV